MTFPVGVDEGAEERGANAAPANAAHETGRVLVVDDEEPLAQMICEALGREGHRAVAVADGRLALERLAQIGRRHPE